jgi:hypothetical protein
VIGSFEQNNSEMSIRPFLMTCAPFLVTVAAWVMLYRTQQLKSVRRVAFVALAIFTVNSLLAASTFLYYQFKPPSPSLPPWQDPEIGNYSALFFLAPLAMFVGLFAIGRGIPVWLICILEIASVPLLMVGYMAVLAF